MMREDGFSLVELVVVMVIAGILLSIATLNYSDMTKRSAIEREAKLLYIDLMAARSDALYTKSPHRVTLTSSGYSVYANLSTASPVTKTVQFPLKWSSAGTSVDLIFDTCGVNTATDPSGMCSPAGVVAVCVDPSGTLAVNGASVDSLVISAARIKLGKRQGGTCGSANITQK